MYVNNHKRMLSPGLCQRLKYAHLWMEKMGLIKQKFIALFLQFIAYLTRSMKQTNSFTLLYIVVYCLEVTAVIMKYQTQVNLSTIYMAGSDSSVGKGRWWVGCIILHLVLNQWSVKDQRHTTINLPRDALQSTCTSMSLGLLALLCINFALQSSCTAMSLGLLALLCSNFFFS